MKLTNEELKKYYLGAYRFNEVEGGYLASYQYTEEQTEYFRRASDFWYVRCNASTAKTLEFMTDATRVSFAYRFDHIDSKDSFEAFADGLAVQIYYVKDLADEGTLTFELPEGRKRAVIYLPSDATVYIKDLEINGIMEPVNKGEKVLWLGDSITQGFGPLRTACTYVSVANRILNYDILNQGIGGYVYDKGSLMPMPGYTPDKIIVSLGTNQFGTESMADIEEYYERLFEIYGRDIPVLCITPIWRGDVKDGEPTLIRFCERLKEIVARYPNIKVVDGFKLVPHLPEYYLDLLHPNQLGSQIYGTELVREIQRLGF